MLTPYAVPRASSQRSLGYREARCRKWGRGGAPVAIVAAAAWLGVSPAGAQTKIDAHESAAYVTAAGDTLYEVAQRYLTDAGGWRALARLNHLSAPRRLPAGMTLRLPLALLRRDATSASIVALSGLVTRWHGAANGRGMALAVPLLPGRTLGESDTISTGADGFATLELDDGSYISLVPNSRIVLSSLRKMVLTGVEDHVIELQKGEVSNEVTHAKQPGDRFEVRTPSIVAGVRGTRFRVNEMSSMTAVEVLDGTVAVGTSGNDAAAAAAARPNAPSQFVGAGQGSATLNGGAVGVPQPLLPAPTLIDPSKLQDGKTVTFNVAPASGADRYRIQIARDADLLDLIRDARVAVPSASFADVPDGTYFVRISSIDANGLEGLPRVYAFERRANELIASASPLAGGGTHEYRFAWRTSRADPESRFRFVLSHYPDLHDPVVDAVDLTENGFVVSDLPPGDYYWRVVSEQYDHGRFYETIGPVRTFTLAK